MTDISLLKKQKKWAEKLGDQRTTDIMPVTGSEPLLPLARISDDSSKPDVMGAA
ncbi:hypothetical protein KDM87_00745 [Undibacterium sp. FT147W]|uniref:Uncharacterized protein n=1 Tax=Undibacterium rivi TaxID=2828729 RepID=A0ABS5GXD2_9BURK|nr:hypothetical protein [Undibacterium rivi]MBR7791108.1 hypothetical protein [Undibacterium rivi]